MAISPAERNKRRERGGGSQHAIRLAENMEKMMGGNIAPHHLRLPKLQHAPLIQGREILKQARMQAGREQLCGIDEPRP